MSLDPKIYNLSTRKKIGKGGFSTIYSCELKKPLSGEDSVAIKITQVQAHSGKVSFSTAFKDVKRSLYSFSKKKKKKRKETTLDSDDSSVAAMQVRKDLAVAEIQYLRMAQGNPYVLLYLQHMTTDTNAILVIERCACDLKRLVKLKRFFQPKEMKNKYPIVYIFYLLCPILQALSHVHALGIIHFDIKEQNILMSYKAIPKLADFGIAKVDVRKNPSAVKFLGANFVQKNEQEIKMGMVKVIGTLRYMAPEVMFGRSIRSGEVGGWSDIWSLGVTLLQLYTGFKYTTVKKLEFKLCQREKDGEALRKLVLSHSEVINGEKGTTNLNTMSDEDLTRFRDMIYSMFEVDGAKRSSADALLKFPGMKAIKEAWDEYLARGFNTENGYIKHLRERTHFSYLRALRG